jgi:phenylacetate-CoA ligase
MIMSSPSTFLLRNLLLPFGDILFGQKMISRLKFLEQAQWWDTDRIIALQNQELGQLMRVAYQEVPFYQDLFDAVKITPDEIKALKDLQRLPVVTKDMLRKGYPGKTTRPTGQKTYEASTSGSTGKNFFVREDAFSAGWYRASFMLALEWAGWSIGEPHLQTGMTLQRSLDRRLKDWLLGCHYVSAYELDDEHLDAILSRMEKYHLRHLWGYPGSLYYLAKYAQKQRWNQPLKSAVTWGDILHPHYRQAIEEAFQTKVFDTYGCAEGIQISAQCEYGNYHLHVLDAIIEFLDDEGVPVTPGKQGHIVVTRLHPGPMPLIRYAIGDMGIPTDLSNCSCGRGFPLMQSVQGRSADVVITPSGNRLIVHYFTGVLEHFSEIDSFQVVQQTSNLILLRIVPYGIITDGRRTEIINALKVKGASDLDIHIEIVDDIPLPPSGKHRFVISEINN